MTSVLSQSASQVTAYSSKITNTNHQKQAATTVQPKLSIVPVNFGLKYSPPKIGLQYHIKDQPQPSFVHEINLAWVTADSDVDTVTNQVIEQNSGFLNPKIVSPGQVRRLIERLVTYLKNQVAANKENNVNLINAS